MPSIGAIRDVRDDPDVPEDLRESLGKLSTFASRLNEEGSKAYQTIRAVEARLVAMDLGVTCWMPTDYSFALGYTKVRREENYKLSGRWCLAYKDSRGTIASLVEAPRHVRMAAAPLQRDLLEALVRTAEKAVEEDASAQAPTGEGAKREDGSQKGNVP